MRPFRRRDRIVFCYDDDAKNHCSIETTVGQLNFFRWMLENGILDYVRAHANEIDSDMVTWQQHRGSSLGEDDEEDGGDAEGGGEDGVGGGGGGGGENDEAVGGAETFASSGHTSMATAPPRSQRRTRSELSTNAPTMAMMRMGGTRVMAFE